MPSDKTLVLEAIRDLEPNAYGVTIYEKLKEKVSFGRIYEVLNRLEESGSIQINRRDQRGFAVLTDAGREALMTATAPQSTKSDPTG